MKIELSNLKKARKDFLVLILVFQIFLAIISFINIKILKISVFVQLFFIVIYFVIENYISKYNSLFDNLINKANSFMNGVDKE